VKKSINFFLVILFYSMASIINNANAQSYYKFSDKINGDFSDEGRISLNLYGGLGIPIQFLYSGELEYCYSRLNISFGLSAIVEKYKKENIFDYNGGKNMSAYLYAKRSFYPGYGRFSAHAAVGGGIRINKQTYFNPYQTVQTKSFAYLFQGGVKYRITRNIGLVGIFYFSEAPCAAGGLSITF
jgi:hypothetical protein